MASKPIFSHRLNRIEVAIWKNESDEAVWLNITFQRTYRDEQGVIQNTPGFRMNDLPAVAFLAVKAYDYLASMEERFASSGGDHSPPNLSSCFLATAASPASQQHLATRPPGKPPCP